MDCTLWRRQHGVYCSLKTYRSAKHPAVLLALEQYNKELSVASAIDKEKARLMEKLWHLEEKQAKEKEKEAPQVAQRRRLFGIF